MYEESIRSHLKVKSELIKGMTTGKTEGKQEENKYTKKFSLTGRESLRRFDYPP